MSCKYFPLGAREVLEISATSALVGSLEPWEPELGFPQVSNLGCGGRGRLPEHRAWPQLASFFK